MSISLVLREAGAGVDQATTALELIHAPRKNFRMSTCARGVALITGAAQGICKDATLRLASDGFNIAINDLPSKLDLLQEVHSQITAIGRKSTVVVADVSVENEVKEMVEKTPLNAKTEDGFERWYLRRPGVTADEWDRFFAINTRGTFLCYKYAAIQMIHQGRG
ncbi:hypothetical protein GYMLUDRAFT_236621 [Collybiopsis luxurians FD-317 M1]|nr:hypothetical protein GYMLUDRAFT_236621 [Collybiopsis luxurians FD-317 M1]